MATGSLAVGLLVFGLLASSGLAAPTGSQPQSLNPPAESAVYLSQLAELDQRAQAEQRADRASRAGSGDAEAERVTLAEQAQVKPPPEPEPAPEPETTTESAPSDPVGPVPGSCGDYSGNRAVGCTLLLEAGFSIDQMSCLDNLWTKESGWNHQAQNPSSGAYGIPQSLPGDKMASHGSDWRTNPATQIRWGLDYISNRYGTPCGAWGFFGSNGWY